ncbi:MAG: DUF1223 domain-containing protein [Silvibacterium sp.]|nr:DUF1223 domain-containing protein [Silvibacterium sp.]
MAGIFLLGMTGRDSASGTARDNTRTPVLVELFTSEGCSSCPPADVLLQAMDREQPVPGARVIVLSEHVDYWNYEGWRDPFSSAEVTARQEAYARRFGQDSAYTPEAVIDGSWGMNGSDRHGLLTTIEEAAKRPKLEIALADISAQGGSVEANVSAAAHPRADLYAVLADDHDQSSVSGGENSGRHLEHVAVLRSIEKVGPLDNGFNRQIHIPLPNSTHAREIRLLIFAQERWTGRIVGVAETTVTGWGQAQQQVQSS